MPKKFAASQRLSEPLQLLPTFRQTYPRGGFGRGWDGTLLSAGRTSDNRLKVAGINFKRIPDFCGGHVLGAVNLMTYDMAPVSSPNRQIQMRLPLIQTPADWIVESRIQGMNASPLELVPLWSVFHFLIGFHSPNSGPGVVTIWDKLQGRTMLRSLWAAKLLQGRPCRHLDNYRGYTHETILTSYRMLAPYLNRNSSNQVSGLVLRFGWGNTDAPRVDFYTLPPEEQARIQVSMEVQQVEYASEYSPEDLFHRQLLGASSYIYAPFQCSAAPYPQ